MRQMHPKVEEFLKKAKEEAKITKEEKDELLISLGLIDEIRSTVRYLNYYDPNAKYDQEKDLCYVGEIVPIYVTDEEFDEICKYAHPKQSKKTKDTINSLDSSIGMFVVISAILSVIMIFGMVAMIFMMGALGLIYIVPTIIYGIWIYSLSNSLGKIRDILKEQ